MRMSFKISVLAASLLFLLVADIPILPLQLVPDADAILGVRRRTRRRTAVVVGSAAAVTASAEVAAANQQAAAAQQQAAPAQQQAAATQQPAAAQPSPAPAAAGKRLPQGTVVTALPGGCTAKAIGGVEYQVCGGNYYRTAFQGSNLVYVVQNPQ